MHVHKSACMQVIHVNNQKMFHRCFFIIRFICVALYLSLTFTHTASTQNCNYRWYYNCTAKNLQGNFNFLAFTHSP